MTRVRCFIILSCLFLLSGCGAKAETPSDPEGTPLEIVAEIAASQPDLPPLEFLTPDSEAFAPYLTEVYGIPEEDFLDGVIGYAGGTEASELAVLVFSDEAAAQSARAALLDYRTFRADSFTGYVPDQAALAEGGTAICQGRYTVLLICAGPDAAREAFRACFEPGWEPTAQPVYADLTELPQASADDGAEASPESTETESEPAAEAEDGAPAEPENDEPEPQAEAPVQAGEDAEEAPGAQAPDSESPQPAPPGTAPGETTPEDAAPEDAASTQAPSTAGDHYDHDAVLAAWQNGDPSGLSEKNRAVYDAAQTVVSQVITGGMTPYQKELAIHDYITAHAHYDQEASSNAPDAAPDPDNDNPYGLLVNGAGICYGYVSTFQLFMDMLEIECVSVSGRGTNLEHGWNMVRLDNEWYCVDVTWDDPTGTSPLHRYFNVTSQFMRQTNHEWAPGTLPEATAVRWAYQS